MKKYFNPEAITVDIKDNILNTFDNADVNEEFDNIRESPFNEEGE